MLLEILKHILTQPDGHLILMQILKRVVLNTPTWVYALFISLIGIDPSLRQPGLFSLAASLAYGLLGGVFPARAARVWSQRFAN